MSDADIALSASQSAAASASSAATSATGLAGAVANAVDAKNQAQTAASDAQSAASAAAADALAAVTPANDVSMTAVDNNAASAFRVQSDARLSATFAPKWKPSTAYTAGAVVQAPDGGIVKAKTTFTSGATYSSANWDPADGIIDALPRGVPGRKYGMVLGTIRNDGTGWAPLNDSNHASTFIDSCSVDSNTLRVQHAALAAVKVGSVIAVPDETLAANGFTCGSSIAAGVTSISIYRNVQVSDYISYNGSSWVSTNGAFTFSFSAGILTLTHASLGSNAAAQVASVTGRGGVTVPCISGAGGATSQTTLKIEFRDWAGTLITTPNTDMKAFVTHGGGRYAVDPATIDTTAFPFSNIWLLGVMER